MAARLHAELDTVLGEARPALAHLHQLPYTLRVIKETLRLYPAAGGPPAERGDKPGHAPGSRICRAAHSQESAILTAAPCGRRCSFRVQ